MSPTIQFHNISTREYNSRSTNQVIRFRVIRRAGRVEFKGDWFNTKWELSRSSWRKIESAWSTESRAFPCKKGHCGGGRSCIGLTVTSGREAYWREFLSDLLGRRESWVSISRTLPVSIPPGEAA